jgi:hypothetical protein
MSRLLKSFLRKRVFPAGNRGQGISGLIETYQRIMPMSFLARKLAVCRTLLIAIPVAALGQNLAPQGNEFPIAGTLHGDQTFPCAAIDSLSGGYLVWQDNSVTTRGSRVMAARLDSGFSAGTSFVVSSAWNSKLTGEQEKPQVALLANGGAVIVWHQGNKGKNGKIGYQQVYARFILPTGAPAKSDVRVGSHGKNNQANPAVAVLADGGVVIVWQSLNQDGSRLGVFGQRFSASGEKLGLEFLVNQHYPENQRTPAVAGLADGNFVVVWISELQRGFSSVDVFARRFDSSGVPLENEFAVNLTTTNICANPSVAASPGGGFAVAWSQKYDPVFTVGSAFGSTISGVGGVQSTRSWDVFARIYDANAAPVVEPLTLNSTAFGDQYSPQVSALGTNYVAVWTSLGQDGSWEGVYGQLVVGSGDLAGTEFRVNTATISRQRQAAVAFDGANLLVVWSSFVNTGTFDLLSQSYLTGE